MNITVLNLCNAANAIYYNSEPYSWYTSQEGKSIYFENSNTKQVVFHLPSNLRVHQHDNGSYAFNVQDQEQTIWLDFYKEIPLLANDLLCAHS